MLSEKNLEKVTLVGGQIILAHKKGECKGSVCTIHAPSDHSMKLWHQNWRGDRGIMERLCPCRGIGHPDPDDYRILNGEDSGIHGCCGVCFQEGKVKSNVAELLARAFFEYIDGQIWAEGAWESLKQEDRDKFITRMSESIIHARTYDG